MAPFRDTTQADGRQRRVTGRAGGDSRRGAAGVDSAAGARSPPRLGRPGEIRDIGGGDSAHRLLEQQGRDLEWCHVQAIRQLLEAAERFRRQRDEPPLRPPRIRPPAHPPGERETARPPQPQAATPRSSPRRNAPSPCVEPRGPSRSCPCRVSAPSLLLREVRDCEVLEVSGARSAAAGAMGWAVSCAASSLALFHPLPYYFLKIACCLPLLQLFECRQHLHRTSGSHGVVGAERAFDTCEISFNAISPCVRVSNEEGCLRKSLVNRELRWNDFAILGRTQRIQANRHSDVRDLGQPGDEPLPRFLGLRRRRCGFEEPYQLECLRPFLRGRWAPGATRSLDQKEYSRQDR